MITLKNYYGKPRLINISTIKQVRPYINDYGGISNKSWIDFTDGTSGVYFGEVDEINAKIQAVC